MTTSPDTFNPNAMPQRPGVGKAGKPISLTANFFEVSSIPNADFHMYNVQITPSVPKAANLQIMNVLHKQKNFFEGNKALAYDGEATMYYPIRLPWPSKTEVINLPDRRSRFTIKIEHVAVVPMNSLHQFLAGRNLDTPQDCVQALDVICRSTPIGKLISLGSSFFSGRNTVPLDALSEIWFGYHQSLRPAHGRLLVNIDIAASVFHRAQPVLDLVKAATRRELANINESCRGALRSELIGVKVSVTHRGDMKRKYRIRDIAKESSVQLKFTIEEDNETRSTNVAKYFQERYNLKLQHPHLPLLIVGSKEKPTYLPMEVCHVVSGERITKKLAPAQTAAMIKKTATKPNVRMENIAKCLQEREYDKDPVVKDFGLKVNAQMVKVNGRVLEPPTISYHQQSKKKTVQPQLGAWQARDASYVSSPPVDNWGVVVFEQRVRENEVNNFLSVLNGAAKEHGVSFKRPVIIPCRPQGRGTICYQDALTKAVKQIESSKLRCQLLLIILPFGDSNAYGEIKRICDTVLDVPSQCMQSKHLQKADPMYCGNLLLKINTRIGGINSVLSRSPSHELLFKKPVIIFGADVTHGAAFSRLPSLAAVVASMDAHPSKYACETRAQKPRQEIIEDLNNMAKTLLIRFYTATKGKKPERILFYRDGVSEGQFESVLRHELNALRDACNNLEPGYTPKITFIIVQKRHHARFFVNQASAGDRSGNIPAGTVVDSSVVHPRQFDFYLCSHGGIQGTSRPTHYHVIFDENNFTADLLQGITYHQCYTYARCTRSVSIVPAVYYAHLAADRARYHSQSEENEFRSGSGSESFKITALPKVLERTGAQMYWI